MNKLFFALSLWSLLAMTSCDSMNDDDFEVGPYLDVPSHVTDYVSNNHSGAGIQDADLDDLCDDTPVYKVELEDEPGPDVDLYYDLDWVLLFEATEISVSDLPDAVMAAIQSEFPGYTIDDDEAERFDFPDGSVQYEVELQSNDDDDLDVVFKPDGSIVCTDTSDDDDDDDDDDNNNSQVNLPQDVEDFISANYAGYGIEGVEEDDLCDDTPVYEVELEDGPGPDIDLYFDLDWNFLFKARDIPVSDLPDAVLDAIESEFPDYSIEEDDVERFDLPDGSVQYEVELGSNDDDEIEVIFNADGSIVCTDDDDDDDDDDDNNNNPPSNLPQDVQDFITANYAGYGIEGVEEDDLCDDTPVYEVELEDGPGPDIDLYFDLDWNFLFEARDIPVSELPDAVLDAIESEFSGYTIEEDDVERFDLPDGSVQYEVELESNDDDDIEVIFNADGSIVCTDD